MILLLSLWVGVWANFVGEYVGDWFCGVIVSRQFYFATPLAPHKISKYFNSYPLAQSYLHRDAVSPKIGDGLFLRVASRRLWIKMKNQVYPVIAEISPEPSGSFGPLIEN